MPAEKPVCYSILKLPSAKSLVGFFFVSFFALFFKADVHLKVGAKMSDAVEIDIFAPF